MAMVPEGVERDYADMHQLAVLSGCCRAFPVCSPAVAHFTILVKRFRILP